MAKIVSPPIGLCKLFAIASLATGAGCGSAAQAGSSSAEASLSDGSYAPPQLESLPRQLLWGDLHLHTSMSADANAVGNTLLDPMIAFQFARGEEVTASNGMAARLTRPLDFLAVTDHAEYLGMMPAFREGNESIASTQDGREWAARLQAGGDETRDASLELVRSMSTGEKLLDNEEVRASAWGLMLEAAEAAYQPGVFTTLAGFEWTSMPSGNNLHRVVLFRDGYEKVGNILPFSAFDSEDPEALWAFLQNYEREQGGQALAIPHNGNLSNGLMFNLQRFNGEELTEQYAQQRSRWEPLVEVTQIKGDGEAHPLLSPNDEFADYGTWDKGNLDSTQIKQPDMLPFEYAREALKNGLSLEQSLGTNPFQFGMIGSTDSHTALATADEDNFWGKAAAWEPDRAARIDKPFLNYGPSAELQVMSWEQLAAGYAAVWAIDNTREAVFDALKRREVYATTGPRISVRFFGSWDYESDLLERPDWLEEAYRQGVPMGSMLTMESGEAPRFAFVVMKDPEGANLDRVQIVKGWLDSDGVTQEQVYDVAWSGGRKRLRRGRLNTISSTVDTESATWSNSVGESQLSGVWTDKDFDPERPAFYYLRVIEIPTPRWVLRDRVRLGKEIPRNASLIHQERAYSSPIWYQGNTK